jgi:hypothetical protein
MNRHQDQTMEDYVAFELTVQLKNRKGESTGKTKTIRTNNISSLVHFWDQYGATHKRRRPKNKGEKLPTNQEATAILEQVNQAQEKKANALLLQNVKKAKEEIGYTD